jgi:hypothetical protein
MSNKEHRWIGDGSLKVRGKLYSNGDVVKGLDPKVAKRLMDRGDLEEVKTFIEKKPEEEPKKEEPLSETKKVKRVKKPSKKGKK